MNDEWTETEMEIATDELLALVDDLEVMSRDIKKIGNDNSRTEPFIASELLMDAATAVRGAAMQISLMGGVQINEVEEQWD